MYVGGVNIVEPLAHVRRISGFYNLSQQPISCLFGILTLGSMTDHGDSWFCDIALFGRFRYSNYRIVGELGNQVTGITPRLHTSLTLVRIVL